MDTKELVEWLRWYKKAELSTPSEYAKGWNDARFNLVQVAHEAADALERLERERDFEQSSRLTSEAQLGTFISNLEAELATLRARVAKMEALRTAGAGLANCAYNLEQNSALPARDRVALRNSYEAWDAVLRSITEEPAA